MSSPAPLTSRCVSIAVAPPLLFMWIKAGAPRLSFLRLEGPRINAECRLPCSAPVQASPVALLVLRDGVSCKHVTSKAHVFVVPQDTFLDADHVRESFPGVDIDFINNSGQPQPVRPFRITFPPLPAKEQVLNPLETAGTSI